MIKAIRGNRLSTDSLSARPCWHGAGPSRCRVANGPFYSMSFRDRRGWGGGWHVPCKTTLTTALRSTPPQDDLPIRAERNDGNMHMNRGVLYQSNLMEGGEIPRRRRTEVFEDLDSIVSGHRGRSGDRSHL